MPHHTTEGDGEALYPCTSSRRRVGDRHRAMDLVVAFALPWGVPQRPALLNPRNVCVSRGRGPRCSSNISRSGAFLVQACVYHDPYRSFVFL